MEYIGPVAVYALLRLALSFRKGDIPICNTRIERESPGLPWNRKVAVHATANGPEIKLVKASEIERLEGPHA